MSNPTLTCLRSIPAHAGEPSLPPWESRHKAVYPRPRGGTKAAGGAADAVIGLSPPTRGNLLDALETATEGRSIPAHAGEPIRVCTRATVGAVYPRPRGGTHALERVKPLFLGLSPPTRGNPRLWTSTSR